MNVPYKFAEGGSAILIAGDKVPEVRLKLAAQGLPKGGGVGFELMDNQKFGTSQFAEQVNYQRGARRRAGALDRIDRHGRVGPRAPGAAQAFALRARAEEALRLRGAEPAPRPQHRRRPGQRHRPHDLQQRAGARPQERDGGRPARQPAVGRQRRRARAGREPAQVRAGDRAGLHPPHRGDPAAHPRREQCARPGRGRHRLLGGRAHRGEVRAQPGPAQRRGAQPAVQRVEPAGRHPAGRRAGRAVEPAADESQRADQRAAAGQRARQRPPAARRAPPPPRRPPPAPPLPAPAARARTRPPTTSSTARSAMCSRAPARSSACRWRWW